MEWHMMTLPPINLLNAPRQEKGRNMKVEMTEQMLHAIADVSMWTEGVIEGVITLDQHSEEGNEGDRLREAVEDTLQNIAMIKDWLERLGYEYA